MAKKNINISSAKKGMVRDLHPSNLSEENYTDALNSNFEDQNGNGLPNHQNEHSNILCTTFKKGYKVIGFVKDTVDNRTYFFLTNPCTGVSEIGYISEIINIQNEDDIETNCGCDFKELLNEALENVEQKSTCKYTVVIEDSCNKCLNFSVNNPIKRPILKTEKSNKRIFWTDGNNPQRWIDINKIDRYKEVGVGTCSEDLESTCLDCDKLLIFPKFEIPCLDPVVISSGGNLRMGTYEAVVAYSDALGNELSNYYSITTPASIFDINNQILDQSMLADRVNKSIKFDVTGIDSEKFSYYKVIVIQRSDIDTKYFINGVYTTDNTTFIVDTDEDKTPTDIHEITAIKPYYTKAKGMNEFQGTLMQYDLETIADVNLQPVVNLMSAFLKWQTVQARENIYENGVSSAKYRGYMRDEVYPFSIQFETDCNYVSPKFPLTGRPATLTELETVFNGDPEDLGNGLDIVSINKNTPNCSDTDRIKRWQYYNTAASEGRCSVDLDCDETYLTYVNLEKYCIEEEVFQSGADSLTLPLDGFFVDLETYMEQVLTEEECQNLSALDPYFTSKQTLCDIFYTDYTTTCDGNSLYDSESVDYDDDCDGNPTTFDCQNINLKSKVNRLNRIENEVINLVDRDCSDYIRIKDPEICDIYVTDFQTNELIEDQFLEEITNVNWGVELDPIGMPGVRTEVDDIFERKGEYRNECNQAGSLFVVQNPTTHITSGVHLRWYYGTSQNEGDIAITLAEIQETKDATAFVINSSLEFSNKLHKNARYFKGEITDGSIILDVTRANTDLPYITGDTDEILEHTYVRVSIYNSCSSTTPIYSEVLDLSSRPDLICLKEGIDFNTIPASPDITNDDFIVTVDSPYTVTAYESDPGNINDDDPYHFATLSGIEDIYAVVPNKGCFGITQRRREYIEFELTYDNIVMDTEEIYGADCPIVVPKLNDCEPVPFEKGSFGYWESIEKYPDNCELYDSSKLNIEEEDIPADIRTEFENTFSSGTVNGVYTLNESVTNLANQPIRHYKFPCNKTSPFITENSNLPFKESVVYPIGVTISTEVINAFLDVAVKNGLITQEFRNSIKSYKLYRGDRRLDKSVKAKGLLYDMRTYEDESGDTIHYSNYPYNDLGDDILHSNFSGGLIPHPYDGDKNNRFTFHSPDYHFDNPDFGSEIKVESYMYGKSRGVFNEVNDHPRWVILSDNARTLATLLATTEVAVETALTIADQQQQAANNSWITTGGWGGTTSGYLFGSNSVGLGISSGLTVLKAVQLAITSLLRVGRLNYEWQRIFRDLGHPRNFASFYTSVGHYNYMVSDIGSDNEIRGISSMFYMKSGRFNIPEENTPDIAKVNNAFRERSTYISLGDGLASGQNPTPTSDFINYPSVYKNYDNYNTNRSNSSRTIASQATTCAVNTPEFNRNIASPYIAVKEYLPSQYGNVNSVNWVPINHCGDLSIDLDCHPIFGGDIYISRMTLKRKLPMFLVDAMNQADLTPFQYTLYNNIGDSNYFINYEIEEDGRSILGSFFPRIKSDVNADCSRQRSLYYDNPTKFYLYYYGIPSFLVESEINLNYRYAKREQHEQFYPQRTDYEEWTQQTNVPIREPNTFFYNNVYSRQSILSTRAGVLSKLYNKEEFDILAQRPSGVIQSEIDASENNLVEPWLVYKPNNVFEFPTKYGKIVDIRTLESQSILGRFENQTVIYNRLDNINDRLLPNQREIGLGTVFSRTRPHEFAISDLGYSGSQHTAIVTSQFGHFWVDAKRGHVFHLKPNASGLSPISNAGMRNWFKEHLPFKILKSRVSGLQSTDLDNSIKGLGIAMGWDERYRRVFITKLDYRVKKEYEGKIDYVDGEFKYKNLTLSLKDDRYFEDCSWTVAYSPVTESWVSFYSFKPNYYIPYNNYFQTGVNFGNDDTEIGLWSHLLTNRSFRVFYGKKYPWRVEYPVKEELVNKTLDSIQYWLDSRRYHNDYDFAENRRIGFDKLWIYNNSQNSGELRLNRQTSLRDISRFPKTSADGTYQDIMVTETDKRWNVNDFYNRVKNEFNNVPIWNWDCNQIDKTINPKAVSFKGRKRERLRGDWFLIRLEQDGDTRYKTIFKWGVNKENIYNQ